MKLSISAEGPLIVGRFARYQCTILVVANETLAVYYRAVRPSLRRHTVDLLSLSASFATLRIHILARSACSINSGITRGSIPRVN